jgi:hypothetical protein
MKTARHLVRFILPTAVCAGLIAFAGAQASSLGEATDWQERALNLGSEQSSSHAQTHIADASDRFPDAPFGVDPIVTGPSKAFRDQQRAAGCDDAIWPNVPAICFPG